MATAVTMLSPRHTGDVPRAEQGDRIRLGNDEDARRAYEGSDDACRVFRKMLESGRPPDDWRQLLTEARAEGPRLRRFVTGIAPKGEPALGIVSRDICSGHYSCGMEADIRLCQSCRKYDDAIFIRV